MPRMFDQLALPPTPGGHQAKFQLDYAFRAQRDGDVGGVVLHSVEPGGAGLATSLLSDLGGPVARGAQTLYVGERPSR